MRFKIPFAVVLVALALVAAALTGKKAAELSPTEAENKQPASDGKRVPVLVELFTSEGCSSCPPADELLARLEQTQPVAGAEVIALSEHVDYWNRLGWSDPYSSAAFSARQNEYSTAFDTDEVYTPQMIVDGHAQLVGSDVNRAREAIANAASNAKTSVTVSLVSEDARAASITLAIRLQSLSQVSDGDKAEVLLAITESALSSNVTRGENAGRHLSHAAVVRKLSVLGTIDSQNGAGFSAQPVVQIDKAWKRDNIKAVFFIQERASRRVLGAAALPLRN